MGTGIRNWTRAVWVAALVMAPVACGFSNAATDLSAPDVPVVADLPSVTDVADTGTDPGPAPDGRIGGVGELSTDATQRPYTTHVTWQGDTASAATIQWQTQANAADTYKPRILFAREDEIVRNGDEIRLPFDAAHVAEGAGFTYETFDDSGAVVDIVQWGVDLSGLVPSTTYYYRAGTWGAYDEASGTLTSPDLSPVLSFRTGRAKGERLPFTFISAGDSRADDGKIAANANRLAAIPADFWLFSGDMTEVGTQAEWWYWFDAMRPILVGKVLMPVQGNHETFADLYYNQFALPGEAGLPQAYKEHGWSFTTGNLHVVGLDSNTDDTVNSQAAWLDSDLAATDADPDIDWTIVMFHHPVYSSAGAHGSTLRVQNVWLPIFEKHHVDLTLTGHDHDYERSKPVRGKQVVAAGQGIVHVVAGSFFAPPYSNGSDWWTELSVNGETGNYCEWKVDGKSMTVTVHSGDGTQILDTFTLTK